MSSAEVVAAAPAESVSGAALTIRGLSHSYGGLEALRDVTFDVPGGQYLRHPRPERRGEIDAGCLRGRDHRDQPGIGAARWHRRQS